MTAVLVDHGLLDLRLAIFRSIAPALRSVGVEEHEVACRLVGDCSSLQVILEGPSIAHAIEGVLSVRVLDAVRQDGRTFGRVGITFLLDE
jgi:hypothetical protein